MVVFGSHIIEPMVEGKTSDSWKDRHSKGGEKNVVVSSAIIVEFETMTLGKTRNLDVNNFEMRIS